MNLQRGGSSCTVYPVDNYIGKFLDYCIAVNIGHTVAAVYQPDYDDTDQDLHFGGIHYSVLAELVDFSYGNRPDSCYSEPSNDLTAFLRSGVRIIALNG